VAINNMGAKLGYIASLGGTREKEIGDLEELGTSMACPVVEEVCAKYDWDEFADTADLAKLSEYDGSGGPAGGGKVGVAIARELELDSGWYSRWISGAFSGVGKVDGAEPDSDWYCGVSVWGLSP
jgi:hypothetical protein